MAAAAKRLNKKAEENRKLCVERRKKAQESGKRIAEELGRGDSNVKKIWGVRLYL